MSDHLDHAKLPEPVRLTRQASAYLDLIRAGAAAAVMLGHARGLFFVGLSEIKGHPSEGLRALYAATGLGHQAVMVFFVLSGLFICSSILRAYKRNQWSWGQYALDRGTRLYAVLIPGLLLGLGWDLLGTTVANTSGIYSHPLEPFGPNVPSQSLTPTAFFGNLAFLQTRLTPVFGSNGPLWSLFNEFWYYVLFPVCLAALLALLRRKYRLAALYVVATVAAASILGSALSGFLVWLAGGLAAVAAAQTPLPGPAHRPFIALSGALSLVTLAASHTPSWLGSDLAIGVCFALFTYALIQIESPLPRRVNQAAKALAGFSYSLYVLHFPILFFLRGMIITGKRWQPDPKHLAIGALLAGAAIVYAFTISRFTEAKTARLRLWAHTKLTELNPRPQPGTLAVPQ